MSWNRTPHRRSLALTTTYLPDAVCQFTYLGSTITDNLSMDAEIDKRIGKACPTLARLTARVWTSPKLSMNTKMAVYNICVVSTLLNGSETWTIHAGQERRLNTFHLRSIRRILGISRQDKVTNADVLSRAGLPSMYAQLVYRATFPKLAFHNGNSTFQLTVRFNFLPQCFTFTSLRPFLIFIRAINLMSTRPAINLHSR